MANDPEQNDMVNAAAQIARNAASQPDSNALAQFLVDDLRCEIEAFMMEIADLISEGEGAAPPSFARRKAIVKRQDYLYDAIAIRYKRISTLTSMYDVCVCDEDHNHDT